MQFEIPFLLMLPPRGTSPAEKWLGEVRLAAARDLLERCIAVVGKGRVFVLAAEEIDRQVLESAGAVLHACQAGDFHFGRALAHFAQQHNAESLAYFGAAAGPLILAPRIHEMLTLLQQHSGPAAVVNNLHSTDWGCLTHAHRLAEMWQRLPTDNPLGWVLAHEAGYQVEAFAPAAFSRADIDTPADAIMLAGHPALGEHLARLIKKAPPRLSDCVAEIRRVIATPASTLAVIGRSSSAVWKQLEERTQIWVRFLVEERGMVASGRLERGEVRSLVGKLVDELGAASFIEWLPTLCDAVLWDTRVWMAQRGAWPSRADRFAADLGWSDQVADPALKELTEQIDRASIPILAGGHGVVSGGVYALLEAMESGGATTLPGKQPTPDSG
jgi:CTP:molybdopterin cytidylyltransferase MocA